MTRKTKIIATVGPSVNSKDGIVNCIKIQLENKKEMLAKDLLNGYKFDENSRVY